MQEIIAQIIGILAMIFNIVSYQGKKQSTVIALQLVGGTLFAINFLMLGAIICEAVTLISIFVGMFRHDRKNSEE